MDAYLALTGQKAADAILVEAGEVIGSRSSPSAVMRITVSEPGRE